MRERSASDLTQTMKEDLKDLKTMDIELIEAMYYTEIHILNAVIEINSKIESLEKQIEELRAEVNAISGPRSGNKFTTDDLRKHVPNLKYNF